MLTFTEGNELLYFIPDRQWLFDDEHSSDSEWAHFVFTGTPEFTVALYVNGLFMQPSFKMEDYFYYYAYYYDYPDGWPYGEDEGFTFAGDVTVQLTMETTVSTVDPAGLSDVVLLDVPVTAAEAALLHEGFLAAYEHVVDAWALVPLSVECADVDECAGDAHGCGASRAVCVNSPGGFSCVPCLSSQIVVNNTCVDCHELHNVWEYSEVVDGACRLRCHAGGVLRNESLGCVAAPRVMHSSAALALRLADYDVATNSWRFAGHFRKAPYQFTVAYAWSFMLDPFRRRWAVENHPCHAATSLCCLYEMRGRYLLGAQFDYIDQPCDDADSRLWVMRHNYRQRHGLALREPGVLDWVLGWDAEDKEGAMTLEVPFDTVLGNRHSDCTWRGAWPADFEAWRASSEDIVCNMAVGLVYVTRVPRQRQISIRLAQQHLRFRYATGSVAVILSRQSHTCVEAAETFVVRGDGDAWRLHLDAILAADAGGAPVVVDDAVLGLGPRGGRLTWHTLDVATLEAWAQAGVFSASVRLPLTLAQANAWADPVAVVDLAVHTETCVDNIHIQTSLATHVAQRDAASMAATYSALQVWVLYGVSASVAFTPVVDYDTWAPRDAVAAFPSYKHGRLGLMAVVSNAPHDDFIAQLTLVHVRASSRQAAVEAAVRQALGDAAALRHVCHTLYPRECLLSAGVADHRAVVRHESVLPHPEVCDRESPTWLETMQWLQHATGLATAWGYQKLARYMQHVCSFTAARGLRVVLVGTQPVAWPTLPPGVSTPADPADLLLAAVTVA